MCQPVIRIDLMMFPSCAVRSDNAGLLGISTGGNRSRDGRFTLLAPRSQLGTGMHLPLLHGSPGRKWSCVCFCITIDFTVRGTSIDFPFSER